MISLVINIMTQKLSVELTWNISLINLQAKLLCVSVNAVTSKSCVTEASS